VPLGLGERGPIAHELLPALSHPVGLLPQPELILERLARLVQPGRERGQREITRGLTDPARDVLTRHAGAEQRARQDTPAGVTPSVASAACSRVAFGSVASNARLTCASWSGRRVMCRERSGRRA